MSQARNLLTKALDLAKKTLLDADGIPAAERRRHLERARDRFHEAWQRFETMRQDGRLPKGHTGFVTAMKADYDACVAALEEL